MPRKPPAEAEAAGQDSFLDVVTNIVGIMIILVMVCGMRIKQQGRSPEGDEKQLEAALAKHQTAERDLMDMTAQTKMLEAEVAQRSKERAELATLVAAIEAELSGSVTLAAGAEQADVQLRTQLASAKLELE